MSQKPLARKQYADKLPEQVWIRKIDLSEIQLPLLEPFVSSNGVETTRRILLLKLWTKNEISVWSECGAGAWPNYSAETIDTAWLAIEKWLAPKIIKSPLKQPWDVQERFAIDIRGHQMAKAALEMGVWALFAQLTMQPLAHFIGGTRTEVESGVSLGLQSSPDKLAQKAILAKERGYRRIKMKIKPGMDIHFIRAAQEAVGNDMPLTADANSAYTLDDIQLLQKLDSFGLTMIEQPLAWDDVFQHGALQRVLKTPLCLDESITNLSKAKEMFALGSGKIINIKAGRIGGLTTALEIHDFCHQSNIPVWCGGMLESGVGRAYNVALASLPNFTLPGDISPSERYWEKDIVTPEWTMSSQGEIVVPANEPGIGCQVDEARIDNLTVRKQTLKF